MFRFYREVLALTPQSNRASGPYEKFSFADGGSALALQTVAHAGESVTMNAGVGDRAILAVKVKDLDATLADLTSRGAKVVAPPSTLWGRMKVAHVRDPEENLIEFQQWLTA